MDKVYVGKIVNTHGIKGEIRIISDFEFKDKVFYINANIIIDDKNYKITTYRKHKQYDMITLEGYSNINDVLFLKNKKIFVRKDQLKLDQNQVLDEDLINFKVIDQNNNYGIITEIFYASKSNKILRVKFKKEVLIPLASPMIKKIDPQNKQVEVELIKGMI